MVRSSRLVLTSVLLGASFMVAACSDPETTKRRHLESGNRHYEEGRYKEAILDYRNALKADRLFGEARYKLAQAYEKTGHENAAREYVRAAEQLTGNYDAQLKASQLLLGASQFELALKHADFALAANPRSVDAHLIRAYALAGQKDVDAAVKGLETAMAEAPLDSRLHTGLGGLQASRGNKEEAERSFRKAIEVEPRSIPARLALAYHMWSNSRPAEAEAAINEALGINVNDPTANRMLAMYLLTNNRQQDAEVPLLRLVEAKDMGATMALADLYATSQRGERARQMYEIVKTNATLRPQAVARMAAIDYFENRRDQAHAAVDAELKEKPDTANLLLLKARWLAGEGKGDQAAELAKKAATVQPNSADAQFVLGMAHAARRQPDEAISAYKEALRLNPRLTAAELEISKLLLLKGDSEQALQHAVAVRKADPRNAEARFGVARALAGRNDFVAAESELKALLQEFPNSSTAHSLYGAVLRARGDNAGSTREFERALALDPADVPALTGLMQIDVREKKFAAARSRVQSALQRAPRSAPLLLLAAQFEQAAGDSPRAEEYFRLAIDVDPTNSEAYNQFAMFYLREKKLDDAKARLRDYAARKPDSVPTRTLIGMIEDAQGNHTEAMKVYESVVKDSNRAPIAANNLAFLYAQRGEQLDMALQLAQNAKQQLPTNPDVTDTLGWTYYKKQMYSLAIPELEFSVKQNPKNAGYQFRLGMAYARGGRPDQARDALNAALQLQPDMPEADEARKTLASLQPQGR